MAEGLIIKNNGAAQNPYRLWRNIHARLGHYHDPRNFAAMTQNYD